MKTGIMAHKDRNTAISELHPKYKTRRMNVNKMYNTIVRDSRHDARQ